MRETNALAHSFDDTDHTLDMYGNGVLEVFSVPTRNWELLIGEYNSSHKRRFQLTPLECKILVEYTKKGIPLIEICTAIGISKQRLASMSSSASAMEDEYMELSSKSKLSDEDYDKFNALMRNPMRILISDLQRAEGISNIRDFEHFNELSFKDPTILAMKMKAKFKDHFSEKQEQAQGYNVTINIAEGMIDDL